MGPQCTAPDYTGVTPAIHNGFLFVAERSSDDERASDAQGGREGPKLRQEGREGKEGGREEEEEAARDGVGGGKEGFASSVACWY